MCAHFTKGPIFWRLFVGYGTLTSRGTLDEHMVTLYHKTDRLLLLFDSWFRQNSEIN